MRPQGLGGGERKEGREREEERERDREREGGRKRERERGGGEGEEGNQEMECFNAKITCQNTLNIYHSFDVSFISVSRALCCFNFLSWNTVALFTGRN